MSKVMKAYSQGTPTEVKLIKFLNFFTQKIIESAHVRINDFVEKSEEESKKEPEDYKRFVYYEPDTL